MVLNFGTLGGRLIGGNLILKSEETQLFVAAKCCTNFQNSECM